MILEEESQAIRIFLESFLLEPDLVPSLVADLAQACADDYNLDPWSALIDLLQDYGYVWPMPWHTAPEDVVYGLEVLWASYGLPPVSFPDLTINANVDAEYVVHEFSQLAQSQQMTLCHFYEDSDYVVLALIKTATLEQGKQAALAAGGQLSAI